VPAKRRYSLPGTSAARRRCDGRPGLERRPAPAAAADPVPDRGRDHPGARGNRLIGRSCWSGAAGPALT